MTETDKSDGLTLYFQAGDPISIQVQMQLNHHLLTIVTAIPPTAFPKKVDFRLATKNLRRNSNSIIIKNDYCDVPTLLSGIRVNEINEHKGKRTKSFKRKKMILFIYTFGWNSCLDYLVFNINKLKKTGIWIWAELVSRLSK